MVADLAETLRVARSAGILFRRRPFDVSSAEGRSLERYRRIAWTAATGAVARLVTTVLGLAILPMLIRYLGKERFGLWTAVGALGAWVAVLDLGLAGGLLNALASAHGRDDRHAAGSYVSTAFFSLVAIASCLVVLAVVVVPVVPWADLLAIRAAIGQEAFTWLILAALGVWIGNLPFSMSSQIHAAYQHGYVMNAWSAAGAVLGAAALAWGIFSGFEMAPLIALSGVGSVFTSVMGFWSARRRAPWIGPRPSLASWAALRQLRGRSLPIFLFQVGALFVNEVQVLVLTRSAGLTDVAEYGVLMRVYLPVAGVIAIVPSSFIASFREAHDRGDAAWTRLGFRRSLTMRLLAAGLAGLAFITLADTLVAAWLGRQDFRLGTPVWFAAAALLVVANYSSAHGELLGVMDRLWTNVGAVLFSGTATTLLTVVLAPRMGVLGALIALAIPAAIVGLFLARASREMMGTGSDV